MVRNETFRRVQEIHESCGSAHVCSARRNKTAGSRVQETGRRESEQARTKKEKAESYPAFRRPRAKRYRLAGSFRFFILLRRQFSVGETLADNLRAQKTEAVAIVHRVILWGAIVEPEALLIQVPEQMEWFNAHISSIQSTLQQRPEIFNSVCVNLAAHVSFGRSRSGKRMAGTRVAHAEARARDDRRC